MLALSSRTTAMLLLIASAAILGGAFAFQYIGGLAPCILCWWQRYAHMAAIVVAAAAVIASGRASYGGSSRAGWVLVAATGLVLLASAGIAAFHVGVEQHWWAGTAECGSPVGGASGIDELRARLLAQPIVRCDEIAWSMFGISMAGYNFILSLALAAFALTMTWRHFTGRMK